MNNTDCLPQLRLVRHVAFDMDGTIYLGKHVFRSTVPFLDFLSETGIRYTFVTNNNSLGRDDYVNHLRGYGIEASAADVVTSAQATVEHLRESYGDRKKLFVLGSPGLKKDLVDGGFEIVEDSPEVVVVGYDLEFTFDKVAQTAYWISQGLPFVATHPDRVCPTDKATVLPDCGAVCALLESATGRQPDAVCGKPHLAMLNAVFKGRDLDPTEVAVIGDRIYTDMEMARRAGCLSVLTLTGETTPAQASSERDKFDLVISGLDELADLMRVAHQNPPGGE